MFEGECDIEEVEIFQPALHCTVDKIVLKRTNGGNCQLALALLFENSKKLFGTKRKWEGLTETTSPPQEN